MASCKVSPIVRVERVDISDFRSVEVSVSIEGATSTLIKDENLSQYITAVCVLSIYDPDSQEISNSVEAVLESKAHWKDDEWYKNARGWDAYLRADNFVPAEGYTTFDIDLSDIVKGGTIQTDNGKAFQTDNGKALWSETYLSYFTYIQVDTQQMEEVKSIPIPDEYIGMSGDYETGVILIGGVINSEASFEIIDSRHVESSVPTDQC